MVQDFGLRLLQRLDNIRRSEQTFDDIRLAAVASGERSVREAFPEYFPAPLVVESTDALPEEEYFDDEAETIYDYSQAALDPSQAEREIAMLAGALSDDHVTVSGSDQAIVNAGWV